MIDFLGYAPDIDPTEPGVMTNCAGIIPTIRGFKGAPSPASLGIDALGAQCYGAAAIRKNDDTTRLFAGTVSGLFELSSTSWTTRTPNAAGSTLTGLGGTDYWTFSQFSDAALASAKTEIPKFISGGSRFANVSDQAPKAAIVEVANNFTFLFDVNDQASLYDGADRPNGWWTAAKGGYTSYTLSGVTEAATGTLHSTPGKITAGRAFGYQIVAYKLRSMYIGSYVGSPVIWDFELIPGAAGALSQNVVVNVGTPEQPRHIFMGWDNFYQFDGGRPIPIGNPIKDSVFREFNYSYYYASRALHDAKEGTVRFYYPVAGSNKPEKCVVYNYRSDRWGRDDRQIEATVDYIAPGVTYDALGDSYPTYDALPSLPYDQAFASVGSYQPAIFDTSHILKSLTGPSASSSITTGDYGDAQIFSTLTRIIPKFLEAPDTATFTNYYRNVLSDTATLDKTVSLSSGRFDMMRSARWHRGKFDMTGDHEIVGFDAQSSPDGEE